MNIKSFNNNNKKKHKKKKQRPSTIHAANDPYIT